MSAKAMGILLLLLVLLAVSQVASVGTFRAGGENITIFKVLFLHYRVGHCHMSEDKGQVFILAVSYLQEIRWYLLQWTGKVLQTLLVTFHGPC
ncbi:UNVERIFIED_CONTAM: hypothetical protein H355_010105 [Colinus virginianus]|nr:hypothetical protein H355_010105 [Colinus virginianus]